MSKVTAYPPGTFCWIDLTTNELDKAKAFYSKLFRWQGEDMPAGNGMTYTMMRLNGDDVAGMGPQMPGAPAGTPATWNSYISVDNMDTMVAKAKSLGANVLHEPMDVMEAGRHAVLADPEGAIFMLWQGKQHIGAKVVNEPGSLVWNELYVNNLENAKYFYTKLFGWTLDIRKMPDGRDYTMFQNNGRAVGAVMQITPDMKQMPSMWTVYFAVANIDESLKMVEQIGGKKDFGPISIPDTGSFAMIEDTVGAHCFIMQMAQEPKPLN